MRHYKLGVFAHNFDSKLPSVLDTKEPTWLCDVYDTGKNFQKVRLSEIV